MAFVILGGGTTLSATCAAMGMVAMFHGDKTSFPQCLGVKSEVQFGAPRAAIVLGAGSFGLGEILPFSRSLEAA